MSAGNVPDLSGGGDVELLQGPVQYTGQPVKHSNIPGLGQNKQTKKTTQNFFLFVKISLIRHFICFKK